MKTETILQFQKFPRQGPPPFSDFNKGGNWGSIQGNCLGAIAIKF